MKLFPRHIIAAAIAMIALFAALPDASAQFRYGPMAGVNFTTMNFRQDLFNVDMKAGPAGGIAGEMMFPGVGIGLDLGLLYQMRASTLDMGERPMWADQGYGREAMDLHTLSIPIHLKLKWQRLGGLEEKISPIVYAGPTFDFTAAHSGIDAMEFSGGDVAIDVGIGAELYRHWQLTAGYSFGMTYLAKAKILTDFSCRANSWTIRLAYYF